MGLAKFAVALALAPAALLAENGTNDTAVEETMLPPLVEFQGKAPKLKVFPGGTKDKEATWYMLEFGAVNEVDSSGKKVSGRSIASLAAEKGITWDQESTVVNGTGATKTRMELYLKDTLTKECQGGGGRVPDSKSVISIETFVFTGAATIEYGNETLEMSATSLKYNVKSTNWPFCDQGNSLQVNMDVKVKGDKPPKMEKKDMEKEEEERKKSGKKGKGVKGKKFKANAGKLDLEMDLPELTLVDGSLVDSEIDMDAKGSKTSITFTFPHFNATLLYDPTASLESSAGGSAGDSDSINGNGSDQNALVDSAAGVSPFLAPVACLAMLRL